MHGSLSLASNSPEDSPRIFSRRIGTGHYSGIAFHHPSSPNVTLRTKETPDSRTMRGRAMECDDIVERDDIVATCLPRTWP